MELALRKPQPFAITRAALSEALRRKVVLIGVIISVAFIALFWLGYTFLYREASNEAAISGPEAIAVAGTLMTVLGLYAVQFLAAFLAILLSVSSVAPEIDSGAIHAVLARPISRGRWLLERWAGPLLLAATYTAVMSGAVLLIARVVAGYQAISPWRAVLLLAFEVVVLAALGLAGSTRFSSVAAGAAAIALFGLAWLGGILGVVGQALGNSALERISVGINLVIPSDGVWRGASYYLQSPSFLALGQVGDADVGIPFAGSAPPSTWLLGWSVVYVGLLLFAAHRRLRRRDL